MSEDLIFRIFKNINHEVKKWEAKEPNLLNEWFASQGIKNPKKFKNRDVQTFIGGEVSNNAVKAVIVITEGKYYIGETHMEEKHGYGYQRYPNGIVYRGNYKQGKKVGGELLDQETKKTVYVGDWAYDCMHGKGKYTKLNGEIYDGDFVKNLHHGKGKMIWPNGDAYEGEFRNGKREGKGIFIFNNGDSYEGDFFNNCFHGKGVYRWTSGEVYEGEFANNKQTGQGSVRFNEFVVGSGRFDGNKNTGVYYSLTENNQNRNSYANY